MKFKVFIFGIMTATLLTIVSCSNDEQNEELQEAEQLEVQAIEADEITEDDT
jgi:hypothetical protein